MRNKFNVGTLRRPRDHPKGGGGLLKKVSLGLSCNEHVKIFRLFRSELSLKVSKYPNSLRCCDGANPRHCNSLLAESSFPNWDRISVTSSSKSSKHHALNCGTVGMGCINNIIMVFKVKGSLVGIVETAQLRWFGHMDMEIDNRLPKKRYECVPKGRRKRRKRKLTWA